MGRNARFVISRTASRGVQCSPASSLFSSLKQRDHGIDVSPERLTVGSYLDRWLTGARHRLKPSTLDGCERDVRNHYEPTLGGVLLRNLRAADIQALMDHKLEEGLSARTVRRLHVQLHGPMEKAPKHSTMAKSLCLLARREGFEPSTLRSEERWS